VGDDIHAIIAEWVAYLRDQKLWGGDDPLFPATEVVNGIGLKFEVSGLGLGHSSCAENPKRILAHRAHGRGVT
jgi:hypothetical protein